MTSPPVSRDSADWRTLKSWLITQIHAAQRELESVDPLVSERAHDISRGEIKAFRRLMKAVEPDKLMDASELEDAPLDSRTNY